MQKWLAALVMVAACSITAKADDAATQSAIKRENIEWLDVWVPDTNASGKPRVLLIGDSITREYGPGVEKALKGKAFVARLATSKSLGDPALNEQVALILREAKFDIVHFNNGMHGKEYTEEQYAAAVPALIETIRKGAPEAKLVCALTTPTRMAQHLDQVGDYTQRVIARNKIVSEICAKEKIPVEDLFAVLDGHPEFYRPDGVHHVAGGVEALSQHVVATLTEMLK